MSDLEIMFVNRYHIILIMGLLCGSCVEPFEPGLEESQEVGMVALCDVDGEIGWVDYTEVEIIEMEGQTPAELLK